MKSSRSLSICLPVLFVWAVVINPVFAQAIDAASPKLFIAPPEPGSWAKHNRYLEVFGGSHQQDYREQDTQGLTTDGTLDTEKGDQDHIGIAARWQTNGGWLVQLQAQRQSGTTNYNGYLQSGSGSLTPYRARTGNVATQLAVQVGYALNSDTWSAMPASLQITPLVQLCENRWQRNLVQYSEDYSYTTQAIGAQLQWQVRPGTVLEVLALSGRTDAASVSASALGFAAEQPGATMQQWHVGFSQDLGQLFNAEALKGWRMLARYTQITSAHDASPLVNGLQAPPNQHQPSEWVIGLQRQF